MFYGIYRSKIVLFYYIQVEDAALAILAIYIFWNTEGKCDHLKLWKL